MIFEEMLSEERAEGKAEGKAEGRLEGRTLALLELLEEFGEVPEDLRSQLLAEKDPDILRLYLKKAAKIQSVDEFLREMKNQ